MSSLRKKIYAAAGFNTTYYGKGRKEFNPKAMPGFEEYLKNAGNETISQVPSLTVDEGFLGSFMPGRFIQQGNLPGFLPFMIPELAGKPCFGVEGACATGSRAISLGIRAVLSDLASAVFVAGFEVQNTLKAIYGADVLAAAAYYKKERKSGRAYFFPGLFAERAKACYDAYGYDDVRKGMAKWYEQCILNARKNPKAQEFHNEMADLMAFGMMAPNPEKFIPYLNYADCSKVSDGASSILILSEEGLLKNGISKKSAVEIVGVGEAEADITQAPQDLKELSTCKIAVQKALLQASISLDCIGCLELHDCFSITALLGLEAAGFVEKGQAAGFISDGHTSKEGSIPTNLSGGLIGFGHPTGATGVRQLVDLWQQLTGTAPNQAQTRKDYGMMINMGGNDKTTTCLIVKRTDD